MRFFRLNLIASVLSTTILSGIIAWLITYRQIEPALLVSLAWIGSVVWIIITARRPVRIMNSFAKAFDEADTTARMPQSDDPELNELASTMNRLSEVNRTAMMSIETRKLYYDRILRIMTHEMRNSIAPIISLSADMANRYERYSAEDIAEAATLIHTQSEGIKRFLDAYYELTHLPQPEITVIEARDFFSSIRKIAVARAGELGISADAISIIVAQNLTFSADRDMLTRAIVNLIRNALEATSATPDPHIEITASVLNEYVNISVADNGPGIAPSVADSLFMPFITTKEGGSGIGLCLSRQIAKLHKGDLTLLDSGRGATATLTIAR
ncbi:MAG: HAMP domain-containing histidine kinase [Bacteroides sp.]|nr:HAMP domain-containing histidine kinase [Bacteroides sp.]MBD5347208.1 HAMP domain-containing histidine kinase [Bacteroides sp.]